MKTVTRNRNTAREQVVNVIREIALEHVTNNILPCAEMGLIHADPAVLFALFALAAPHLQGEDRDRAVELAGWYAEEAEGE